MTARVNYRELFNPFLTDTEPHNGEWRGYCPGCEDPKTSKTPSASFNFEKSQFMCFKSCGGMSLKSMAIVVEQDQRDAKSNGHRPSPSSAAKGKRGKVSSITDAPSKRNEPQPLPSDDLMKQFEKALLQNKTRMEVLTTKRGLSVDTVKKFRLGFDRERYTIPVYDKDGTLVNIRRYNPAARQSKDKMYNLLGYGEARLFLVDALAKWDTVIITEGELDAIIGRQYGLPTMSHTAGASVWKSEWNKEFVGKTVYVCYDADSAGDAGAKKVALSLTPFAEAVYRVSLPPSLNTKGFDLTNYLHDSGYTAKDFRALMEEAKSRGDALKKTHPMDKKPIEISLENSQDASLGDSPMELTVLVSGKVQPAYNLPKNVEASCTLDFGPKCASCPMQARGGEWSRHYRADDKQLLAMLDVSSANVQKIVMKDLGVPSTCTKIDTEAVESWSVEELLVIPSIDAKSEETQTPMDRRLYNVGNHDTRTNAVHRITGFNTPDPRTQRGIFQAWKTEPVLTNIDKFHLNARIMRDLKVFRPKKGQTPLERMEDIARDMAANVTRIYGRDLLHMAYDATWHSVMDFTFNGHRIGKGWLELLVMGDTRTGKSEVAHRLTEHYQSGVLKSCEGITLPGLVGGATQVANSWFVKWGVIPLNDRRLVILDEVSGIADKNVFEQMSAVRSSGKAQITKIITQETSARTRLIWISNPVDGRTIAEMSRGAIEGIRDLVKNPEDIARFDLAMSAASADVPTDVINDAHPPEVPHKFKSDRCAALVNWAWSRKAEDVVFVDGVEDYIFQRATEIGGRYVADPPLIQGENVRIKVARLACAIAARVFSSSDDGVQLLVKPEHVDSAIELMDRMYGMKSFGYARHSARAIRAQQEALENKKACRKWLILNDDAQHALRSLSGGSFKLRDFEEFADMQRDEAQAAVRTLMRMSMVPSITRGVIKMSPALIEVLRELEDEEDERNASRPNRVGKQGKPKEGK